MPKVRQTCTNCSLRRQKCDRKKPCTRCVRSNDADSCSREWQDGYDPLLHRVYPKPKAVRFVEKTTPSALVNGGTTENAGRDTSLMQNVTTTQETHSPTPTSQTLAGETSAALGVSAVNEPNSSAFITKASAKPSKYVTLNVPSLLNPHVSAESPTTVTSHSHANLSPDDIERQHLQSLVPTSKQIIQLVEYHDECLLWYHGCLHGPTFRAKLNKNLHISDGLQLKNLDFRWSALLFSILAASLTCTSDSVARSWGFSETQKRHLSEQWYQASLSCLNQGDYTSKPSVYSIQAIQILTMSAHALAFSMKQFTLFGTALRIAQNLGLQRLAQNSDLDNFRAENAGNSPSGQNTFIRREIGRRIWTQMCTQDWFSIPSSDMYFINKRHFTSSRPRRVDDRTLLPADDRVPVATDSGNLLYDMASVMADFHDSITALSDPMAKYDRVLKSDARIRAIGTESAPHLLPTETTHSSGPPWVRWARSVAAIVQAHKIIMIHSSFLGRSFTDPRYMYTRWASVAASKTIIREVGIATTDVERPAFWHDQVRSKVSQPRSLPPSDEGGPKIFINDVHRRIWLVQASPSVSIFSIVRKLSPNLWNTGCWWIRQCFCLESTVTVR